LAHSLGRMAAAGIWLRNSVPHGTPHASERTVQHLLATVGCIAWVGRRLVRLPALQESLPRRKTSNCPKKNASGSVHEWPDGGLPLSLRGLDTVTSQHLGPHIARKLGTVNEENFLAGKKREATKWWWTIHTKIRASFPEGASGPDSPPEARLCQTPGNNRAQKAPVPRSANASEHLPLGRRVQFALYIPRPPQHPRSHARSPGTHLPPPPNGPACT
jgi:hypothetical protein